MIHQEFHDAWGPVVPRPWRPALVDSRRWLNSLATASTDGWRALQPAWQRAAEGFSREAERVGVAAVSGTLDALLNSLHPRLSYRDGVLAFQNVRHERLPLHGRRLVLMPMLAAPEYMSVNFDLPDIVSIAYPLRRKRETPPNSSPASDSLSLMIGAMRAAALRILAQPLSMNTLAQALNCSAASATYHCNQLALAGLIDRERFGKVIQVTRSARADELINLLAEAS